MSTSRIRNQNNKAKVSIFKNEGQKPQLKKLITRLSQSHETSNAKIIQQILESRSNKINELRRMRAKCIWQKPMIPTSSSDRFSYETPISANEVYLDQKIRTNIIAPNRFYSQEPNVKAGNVDPTKMINYSSNSDPRVISQKFQQFVRIMQQQSGVCKKKRLSESRVCQGTSLPSIKSPYKITMKKTYFKKYPSDQYNFYRPPIKQISRTEKIFELTTMRQSTQRSRQRQRSRELSPTQSTSPRGYQTLDQGISRASNCQREIKIAKTLDPYRQF